MVICDLDACVLGITRCSPFYLHSPCKDVAANSTNYLPSLGERERISPCSDTGTSTYVSPLMVY